MAPSTTPSPVSISVCSAISSWVFSWVRGACRSRSGNWGGSSSVSGRAPCCTSTRIITIAGSSTRISMSIKARSRDRVTSSLARRLAGTMLLAVLATASLACRADTVASLLGNFTINQYCGLQLADDAVNVHYAIVFGQLPALRELHLADVDGDGVTSQAERDAYAQRVAPSFANQLKLTVDGVA